VKKSAAANVAVSVAISIIATAPGPNRRSIGMEAIEVAEQHQDRGHEQVRDRIVSVVGAG
jgi:hypothetical protein